MNADKTSLWRLVVGRQVMNLRLKQPGQIRSIDPHDGMLQVITAGESSWEHPGALVPLEEWDGVVAEASLPWIEEPTRAGWWWFWAGAEAMSTEPRMRIMRVIDCSWASRDIEEKWLSVVTVGANYRIEQWRELWPEGRWSGPVEPPKAPDEEPTPNAGDERQPPRPMRPTGGQP